jgi:hypothetical protein
MEENEELRAIPHRKNKHTDDLIDHYWGSINYIADLIKAAEIKAGLILTFYGVLLNFVYSNSDSVIQNIGDHVGFYVLSGIWFCCILISVYFSVRCFMPRIEDKYDKNILFFGDVISSFGDIREFSKTFYQVSLDEDKIFEQLGQQIYINSKIASVKFKNINKSLRYLAIGLVLMMLLILYYAMFSMM